MPRKLKTKRRAGAAYGAPSSGPQGRAKRNLRTNAGRVKGSTQRKIKVARSSPKKASPSVAAHQSPAVQEELQRLKQEISQRNEEISEAAHVLKKTKAQLKAATKRRALHGDKTKMAEISSQIKALAARILDLSEEHRSLSAVKHSQQFAIRRLKDEARDYVERYQSLKEEQAELKRQGQEERKRKKGRAPAYAKAVKEEEKLRKQIAVMEGQLERDRQANEEEIQETSKFAIQKFGGPDRKRNGGSQTTSPSRARDAKKSPTRSEKLEAEREKRAAILERRIEILEHEIMKGQKRRATKLRKKRQEYDDLEDQQVALQNQIDSLQLQLSQSNELGRTLISQIKSFKILSEHPEETDDFKKKSGSSFRSASNARSRLQSNMDMKIKTRGGNKTRRQRAQPHGVPRARKTTNPKSSNSAPNTAR